MTPSDVAKLHTESLQLRNQQFQLATLSLAGSGLTAWIAPVFTALTQGFVPELALVAATMFWLILLTVLFIWSLSLRMLISIISQYLDLGGVSEWEGDYRTFTKQTKGKLHTQTDFTAFIFVVYGLIATGGGAIAAYAAPDKVKLSEAGLNIMLSALCVYLMLVWLLWKKRNRNELIRETWKRVLEGKVLDRPVEVRNLPPEQTITSVASPTAQESRQS